MKKILYLFFMVLFFSCESDYLIDGGVADPNVNMTTYDFLKSKSLFDTLVMIIDQAGLKDEVNSAGTFYAPTNYSIKKYVDKELTFRRGFDPIAQFTFDSIAVGVFDSLAMYIFTERITRDSLVKEGKIYKSLLGRELKLSNEPEKIYVDPPILVDPVGYLYFINKRGTKFDEYEASGLSDNEKDTRERIQTSGIISTTGVIHVINNTHVLFFHEPK